MVKQASGKSLSDLWLFPAALFLAPFLLVGSSFLYGEVRGLWKVPTNPSRPNASPTPTPTPSDPPTPEPTPTPTPFPTPTPGVPELIRQGGGWNAQGHFGGGTGLAHDTCTVNSLLDTGGSPTENGAPNCGDAGGTCVGTFRQCVTSTRLRPRYVNGSVGGTVTLGTSTITIDQPYLTVEGHDFPDPGLTLQQPVMLFPPNPAIKILKTHDIIIRGIRIIGAYEADQGSGQQLLMYDGESNRPECSTWDDEPEYIGGVVGECNKCGNSCDTAPDCPACDKIRDVILDNVTIRNAQDDAGSFYGGVTRATSQYNFYYNNFHPTTRGAGGWKPLLCETAPNQGAACTEATCPDINADGPDRCFRSRQYVSDYYNVYWSNGERQPAIREGDYDADLIGNVIGNWKSLNDASVGGEGTHITDPPNNKLNGIANVYLPGTWRPSWDCYMAGNPGANVSQSFWGKAWWAGNLFSPSHATNHCIPRNAASPYPRPYPTPAITTGLDTTTVSSVISEAGMGYPTAQESSLKNTINAEYLARVAQCTLNPTGPGCPQ